MSCLFVLGLGLCSVVACERWCFCFVCGKESVVVWFHDVCLHVVSCRLVEHVCMSHVVLSWDLTEI